MIKSHYQMVLLIWCPRRPRRRPGPAFPSASSAARSSHSASHDAVYLEMVGSAAVDAGAGCCPDTHAAEVARAAAAFQEGRKVGQGRVVVEHHTVVQGAWS
jgi:hypothetical protein